MEAATATSCGQTGPAATVGELKRQRGGQKRGTEEDGRQNDPFYHQLDIRLHTNINNGTNCKVLKINGTYGGIRFTVDATHLKLFQW
jgi:hypothetical protein